MPGLVEVISSAYSVYRYLAAKFNKTRSRPQAAETQAPSAAAGANRNSSAVAVRMASSVNDFAEEDLGFNAFLERHSRSPSPRQVTRKNVRNVYPAPRMPEFSPVAQQQPADPTERAQSGSSLRP
jgi:hypothetical protein